MTAGDRNSAALRSRRRSVDTSARAAPAERVAMITGAGRNIGRAVALDLASAGADIVIVVRRSREEARRVADEVRALGRRALVGVADVRDQEAIRGIAEGAREELGPVNVLVNNAGRGMKYVSPDFLTEPPRFWETDPETWKMVIDTNVNGPFFMARAVVPRMLEQGGGSIINVSMNYETMKRRGFSPYGPSKAALESESIIWAQDLEDTGIRLNVVLPGGATETGMIPPGVPGDVRSRLLRPEIIGPPAVYLASDDSRHLNGRRLVATEWSPENPDGRPAADGLGV